MHEPHPLDALIAALTLKRERRREIPRTVDQPRYLPQLARAARSTQLLETVWSLATNARCGAGPPRFGLDHESHTHHIFSESLPNVLLLLVVLFSWWAVYSVKFCRSPSLSAPCRRTIGILHFQAWIWGIDRNLVNSVDRRGLLATDA